MHHWERSIQMPPTVFGLYEVFCDSWMIHESLFLLSKQKRNLFLEQQNMRIKKGILLPSTWRYAWSTWCWICIIGSMMLSFGPVIWGSLGPCHKSSCGFSPNPLANSLQRDRFGRIAAISSIQKFLAFEWNFNILFLGLLYQRWADQWSG